MEKKISQLTAKGANLASTDLLEISEVTADGYASKYVTGAEVIASAQTGMQEELISGTNIKTINSNSLLGSGDVDVQPTLVSGTNIKTVNGNSLLGSGDLVISTGLTIGTTAITSGTVGRLLFEGTGNVVQESANLFWDNTNSRLGIGTASPSASLHISGAGTTSSTTSFLVQNSAGSNALQITDNRIVKVYNGLDLSGLYLYANGTSNASMFGGTSWVFDTVVSGGYRFRTAGNTDRLRIESTGNVLINTTTDAGYKLDVNGTARVQGKLSVNTPTAASAVMEVTSTTQGFLPPRMTNAQMVAIATPASGLMVYDTTNNKMCVYDGTAWQNLY